MGCWEETCAITRSPIFEGDRVVMVVPHSKPVEQYRKCRNCWWIDNEFLFQLTRHIEKGTYNEYGWINELPQPDDFQDLGCWFILEDVWKEIIKPHWALATSWGSGVMDRFEEHWQRYSELKGWLAYGGPELKKNFAEEFYRATYFAGMARIDLEGGTPFSGMPAIGDEIPYYETMLKLMQEQLKRIKKPRCD